MKKNIHEAMSLTEILLVLLVLSFIISLSIPTVNNISFNYKLKMSVVKADYSIKEIVENLLNNSHNYSKDFAYNLGVDGSAKFRNAFYENLVTPRTDFCPVHNGNGIQTDLKCYFAADGLVWGVPYTDFQETGIVYVTKRGVSNIAYVPITVYPVYNHKKANENASEYFYNNAMVYGLRKDGDLIFLDQLIEKEEYPKAIHYEVKKYLK